MLSLHLNKLNAAKFIENFKKIERNHVLSVSQPPCQQELIKRFIYFNRFRDKGVNINHNINIPYKVLSCKSKILIATHSYVQCAHRMHHRGIHVQ